MYNSDGYVMIDMKDVNMSQSSQHISGIYNRVVSVIDTNKLALIINAGSNTPMAAVVHKRLNYYVINTTLYIFTINSNDIVIIEEAGTATVDVEIVPTLTEGVKVADFAIGSVEGSIYAPAQESEINDNVTATNTTWSSSKIADELSDKADSSSLATVATTGDYSDLSGTPTIPVLTDLIDDSTEASNKVWSSDKTAAEIAAGAGVTIDDTTTSLTKTWSSSKIDSELSDKADVSATYTKTEVDNALSLKQNATDNNLNTTNKTVVGAINEIKSNIDFNSYNAVNWGTYRGTFNVTGGQWNTIANGNVRDVNSFTSKTDNKITLPDDSLYMVFANVSTNDGSGLVGLIATDNNTELATFLYNKITGQSNKYMGYWVIAGAQNKEISLKVFAQGSGITATVEIDVVRISLSRDTN